MSSEDIEAGARWGSHVTNELSETRVGIICLTKDNQTAPWILFEAGALAKSIESTFVIPYLVDLEPANIQRGPLNQFQAKKANKTETCEIIRTLNRRLENPLPDSQIERTFTRWWPDLEVVLNNLPDIKKEPETRRSLEDMLSETLELVRSIYRSAGNNDETKVIVYIHDKDLISKGHVSSDEMKKILEARPTVLFVDDDENFTSYIKKVYEDSGGILSGRRRPPR
jgi:hypothetical protein